MAGLPLVGDEFAGYRVRAVLGRGGMSVVYQAENLRLSSVIALKVLAPDLASDDVFRARFLEESRIAASLNHPNVIPIYDMGSQDDLLYIAMRYVSGTDMRQMIKKRGRILPATALFLVGQAARALDAAHRRGLVHRDVKPGNLLIERGADEDDPDHVYLADFGITKHAMSRSGLTSTGQFLGTIDYVAPEQIRGTSVLGLADQYSLGCVLYECLTGRVPFEKDLDAAIIWAHVEETPTMPTILRPELPPQIDEVFGRVLAKRPDERYGSTTADPQTRPRGITPVSRPSIPPDQFSWSGRISQPSAPAPVAPDPVAPGSAPAPPPTDPSPYYAPPPTAAQPSGSRHSGGTLASHRRQYAGPDQGGPGQQAGPGLPSAGPPAGPPPREPRWYRQPRWIAVLAAVGLLLVGLGTWAGLKGSGSHHNAAPAVSHKPEPKTSALMAALILANKSADAAGELPPSTFPNQQALYAAYTAKVAALSPGNTFKENFADCESQLTYGETSWNHQFHHTPKYTVGQMIMNKVTDDQAAGRVFCNYTQGLEYMVWTQNDGHLLGYVAGPVHTDVWDWWVKVHHNIGIGGSPMDMQMPGTSPSASAASPSMSAKSPSPSTSGASPSPSMSGMGG
jgi:serine/threonine-protein kinase